MIYLKNKTFRRLGILGLAAGYFALSKYCKNNVSNIDQDDLDEEEDLTEEELKEE